MITMKEEAKKKGKEKRIKRWKRKRKEELKVGTN